MGSILTPEDYQRIDAAVDAIIRQAITMPYGSDQANNIRRECYAIRETLLDCAVIKEDV